MSNLLLNLGEDINDHESGVVDSIDVGRNPLARAVEVNNRSLVEMLLKAGADVNALPSGYRGKTALQCAAAQGSLGIAKKLIDLGADINVGRCKAYGRSVLEAAAECGKKDMVQFLLSEGLETTGDGRWQYVSAFAMAQLQGHHVMANILKEHQPWTVEDHTLLHSKELLESDAGALDSNAGKSEKDNREFGHDISWWGRG